MKKHFIKNFIDEIYSKSPMRNNETNKIVYNHTEKIWSIDLADMVDYKISNNKGFRYIFVIINIFSKYLWCIHLKNKNCKALTDVFSNFRTTSK